MVSYAGAELIQMAALAIRTGTTASVLAGQLSIHPSHAERFIKIAAHDHHDICEVGVPESATVEVRRQPGAGPRIG
jgi:hypothetical protein